MQVSLIVTEDVTRDSIAYGSNRPRHLAAFRPHAEASYDTIYFAQIGGAQSETSAQGFSSSTRTAAVPARARTRHHHSLAPRRFVGAAARPLVAATVRW
jgi:hypothetical protein